MKDIKTAAFIAYKSILKGNKSTVTLLIFILSLSFLNMMFISGILNGLENLFYRVIISTYASDVTVNPQETPQVKQFIINQNQVQAEIQSLPGVIATTRRYSLGGSISYDKDKNGQYKTVSGAIIGIDPIQEEKVLTLNKLILKGQYLSDTDTDSIVLSSALAGGYGVPAPSDLGGAKVGDKVQITYANGVMRTYTIKGIYNDSIGIFETFITSREAESVLNVYNSASQILVKTSDARPIIYYQTHIQRLQPKLKIQTYLDLLGSFKSFLDALSLISIIVSAISVIVAAITIFVIIYVNAVNKRKQIGILKAIGIKQQIIILSYVFQAIFYTFCGIIIGSFIVFVILTPLLAKYPINVEFGYLYLVHSPVTIIGGIVSLLVAGLLAGYFPAKLITKQSLLKAIWG
ncbi:MAG: FtsX-like permease family protein [Patescibacteria group bacterium]|nr:FtsX-like permease family protein [Patescibacteria group bacterium]